MIVKFIIILALIILYAVSIVRSTIVDSWVFWKNQSDSAPNNTDDSYIDDSYIEFINSRSRFIYDNTVSSAAKLIIAAIFLLLLFFYEK